MPRDDEVTFVETRCAKVAAVSPNPNRRAILHATSIAVLTRRMI